METRGLKYGRLIVVDEAKSCISPNGKEIHRVLCLCDCGKTKVIRLGDLRSGRTQSCGCLQRERTVEENGIHGMYRTPTHNSWRNMKERCLYTNHKSYKNYGGRGITVCRRWFKFRNFYKDMGDRPEKTTLERINNDGGYCPDNCKWASIEEQARNRRKPLYQSS